MYLLKCFLDIAFLLGLIVIECILLVVKKLKLCSNVAPSMGQGKRGPISKVWGMTHIKDTMHIVTEFERFLDKGSPYLVWI